MEKHHDIHLRFYMSRELHKKAWEILRSLDRDRFLSYVDMVSYALVAIEDYERMTKQLAEQEKNERLIREYAERIAVSAENIMKHTIPSFLTGSLLSSAKGTATSDSDDSRSIRDNEDTSTANTMPEDEIDWNFLGEG